MRGGGMASSSSSSSSPCAACKFLRRKCTTECVFAPYFPPDQPHKFSSVHKIFGASNITKLLNDLPVHQREDAVNSLAYEADARVKDPVYGCVGAISLLQRQVAHLQQELAIAQQDLARYTSPHSIAHILPSALMPPPPVAAAPSPPLSSRELMSVREQYHEQQFTREQILEIARFGGGSYETGLAVLGLAGPSVGFSAPSLAAPPPHSSPRTGSDSSAPPGISHLSPP